jgi:solute carrier family 45, member 1/2/4
VSAENGGLILGSVEQSYGEVSLSGGSYYIGTPYLLSLGLSKAQMSLVWLAGPVSGLGCVYSAHDRVNYAAPCGGDFRSLDTAMGYLVPFVALTNLGRRRPFMVAGSALVGINLLIIGWTRELGALFFSPDTDAYHTLVIWIAVFSVYLLDFAINAGMVLGDGE